jgi:hypothetical protein
LHFGEPWCREKVGHPSFLVSDESVSASSSPPEVIPPAGGAAYAAPRSMEAVAQLIDS